jgi:hypothetical protein
MGIPLIFHHSSSITNMLLTTETQIELTCNEAARTQSRDPITCKAISNKLLNKYMIREEVKRDEIFLDARMLYQETRPAHKQVLTAS